MAACPNGATELSKHTYFKHTQLAYDMVGSISIIGIRRHVKVDDKSPALAMFVFSDAKQNVIDADITMYNTFVKQPLESCEGS